MNVHECLCVRICTRIHGEGGLAPMTANKITLANLSTKKY